MVLFFQIQVATLRKVREYKSLAARYIEYLRLTHFRETLCCWAAHFCNNVEDHLLLGVGFSLVISRSITVGDYLAIRAMFGQFTGGTLNHENKKIKKN